MFRFETSMVRPRSDIVRRDIRLSGVHPMAVGSDVRVGRFGWVSYILWIAVCYQGICGQEIGINGIYEIPLSLDTDENKITHQFYVIPKLTETCILGIDFLTRNSVILNSKTKQLSYVVNKNRITIDDEIKNVRKYKVTIKGAEVTLKPNGPTKNIEDPALEIHREKITKLLDKNKDMMVENFYVM